MNSFILAVLMLSSCVSFPRNEIKGTRFIKPDARMMGRVAWETERPKHAAPNRHTNDKVYVIDVFPRLGREAATSVVQ